MADWYVNINNTSGTADGLSEATGWTDLNDVNDNEWGRGITGGDRLFIKAGESGATYGLVGSNVNFYTSGFNMRIDGNGTNNEPVEIIGYPFDGTTNDIPMNEDRPAIYCERTNGAAFGLYGGHIAKHLRFIVPAYTLDNLVAQVVVNGSGSRMANCSVTKLDGAGGGDRAGVIDHSSGAEVEGCEFEDQTTDVNWPTRDDGYNCNFTSFSGSTPKGCVFKQNTTSYFFRYRTTYGTEVWRNCIFISNGNALGILEGSLLGHAAGYSTVRFENCIFYNMDVGFNPMVPVDASSIDTETEWRSRSFKMSAENCIFENCGTGVLVPSYTDPSGWTTGSFYMNHVVQLSNCVFALNTTNTSGDLTETNSIYASGSVFKDAPNGDFRLNDIAGRGALVKERLPNFEMNLILSGAVKQNPRPVNTFISPFTITDEGSLSLGTGDVEDIVTVSGRSFQKVSDNPIVWRRV